MRAVILLIFLTIGLPVTAQDGVRAEATLLPLSAGSALGLSDAMEEVRANAWNAALAAAARAGPVARDVIEWQRLRAGLGTWQEALDFLTQRPDWPGLDYLRQEAEGDLPDSADPGAVAMSQSVAQGIVAFFGGATPKTGRGTAALVAAWSALGREGDAAAEAALAWIGRPMTAEAEGYLLSRHADALSLLHPTRLDALLWAGQEVAARRSMARVDPGTALLARARLALRSDTGAAAAVAAVPPALKDDPGLAFDRFRWLLAKGQRDAAVTLLRARSADAASLGRPAIWAEDRADLARRLLQDGDAAAAYAVAADHHLSDGATFAALEWLAGYAALRHTGDPVRALAHFDRFAGAVATPISLGRAGYWRGRALTAIGDTDAAQAAYAAGARWQTSFYGLLAAEAAGLPLDPALAGRDIYPPLADQTFRDSTVLEAGLLLQAAGERDLAERFLTHLAESLDASQAGTLADLVLALGEPHVALLIAKRVADRGITLPRAYYPVVDLGVDPMPVARELALAIARRESEFDPGVASGVGASGLMQLMPGTAREVAGDLGLSYSQARLFSDPSYNATLGTAYLAGLIARFGPSPILVAAGYNAGPGRPIAWIRDLGDPRQGDVDVVDWIEAIPFEETRNYVMRVAESLPVYRARIAGRADGPLEFTRELRGLSR